MTVQTGARADTAADLPRHSLYGLTLASDFAFRNRLLAGRGTPDLVFARVFEAPEAFDPDAQAPVIASPVGPGQELPVLRIYRLRPGAPDEVLVFNYTGSADHYIYSDRILTHSRAPEYDYLVEIQLLGDVLSTFLERRGRVALHASAVVAEERAIGFLASNKGGKSSLAATLMQAGCPLLTDDILPLELAGAGAVAGHPGFPQMRMWPEVAAHFLHGDLSGTEIVHPAFDKLRVPVGQGGVGAFHEGGAVPLGCLLVPEMVDDPAQAVELTPLPMRELLGQLMGNSFAAAWIDALGLQARRFPLLMRVAATVPILRLRYPKGMERLPDVVRQILAQTARLPSP